MKNETELEAYLRPFRFDLPPELIAREPTAARDGSRLLVMDRRTGRLADHRFADLPALLEPGDLLIRNATRVSQRRVFLRRATGARIECLFLDRLPEQTAAPGTYDCLVRNSRKIKEGEILLGPAPVPRFRFARTPAGRTRLTALDADDRPAWPDRAAAEEFFARHGEIPLPPYLKRSPTAADRDRYQTVYAGRPGSVAAPTAGLHFTAELLDRLAARSVRLAQLELLISYGTFAPLEIENFETGRLHPETYVIPADFPRAAFAGAGPDGEDPLGRQPPGGRLPDGRLPRSGRRIAVGTTSLRALEDNLRKFGEIRPGTFATELFLKPGGWRDEPGDRCASVDGLLTNFHLPASSLLLLVAAFCGTERILTAYRHAVAHGYRFYSYGDAMLII